MATAPVITLTTDFGLRDPFVGIMKGVILGICREAHLVDLTHEIAPHDVLEAALALESAWRFFPPGSIHLAVVDPGVGTGRRALALMSEGHYFVGPDNGLFTFALLPQGWSAISVEAPSYRLPAVSHTFHGRDIFAPAAGHLASGVPLGRLGPSISDPIRLVLPCARRTGDEIVGEVIGSDRFGNLVTSVTAGDVAPLAARGVVAVELAGRDLGAPMRSYEAGPPGIPRAIMGSGGRLEVFVKNSSARAMLGVGPGAPVKVRKI
ncbi:MAG TPA: SAM-dependent chlorinase/fluorinase [Candidatus Methylomirabilis sp.]|nr:SAM-dependent chlorinase/fluorinase [Candidatus Methylomirabilis sp.]